MIRIYVQNKPLVLVDKLTEEIETYLSNPGTLFADKLKPSSVSAMVNDLKEPNVSAGVLLHSNIAELLNAFKSYLTLIKAGGGFVYTEAKEVLLIFRKGKWDLPKGKLEDGETLAECAGREVKEETGIEEVKIIQPLEITYHTYFEREQHILKESHWFLMKTRKAVLLTPQSEEGIEQCLWVPLRELANYKSNMHASIVDVVHKGEKLLVEL